MKPFGGQSAQTENYVVKDDIIIALINLLIL